MIGKNVPNSRETNVTLAYIDERVITKNSCETIFSLLETISRNNNTNIPPIHVENHSK